MVDACVDVGVVWVAGWDGVVEESEVPLLQGVSVSGFFFFYKFVEGRRTLRYARISRGTWGTAVTAIAKALISGTPRNRIVQVDCME